MLISAWRHALAQGGKHVRPTPLSAHPIRQFGLVSCSKLLSCACGRRQVPLSSSTSVAQVCRLLHSATGGMSKLSAGWISKPSLCFSRLASTSGKARRPPAGRRNPQQTARNADKPGKESKHRKSTDRESKPKDEANAEDLLTLFQYDRVKFYSFKLSAVIAMISQIVIFSSGTRMIYNGKDIAARYQMVAKEKGKPDTALKRLRKKQLFWRGTGVLLVCCAVASYYHISRLSTRTVMSLVMNRRKAILHVKTFPVEADYLRREWHQKGWKTAVALSDVRLRPGPRSGWCILEVDIDGEPEKFDVEQVYLREEEIWKSKFDIGEIEL